MQKNFIRILFLSSLFFSSLWSMSPTQISNVLDLARNISLASSGQQLAVTHITPPPSTLVVHDMQNQPLTEINIDINGIPLAFVSSRWSTTYPIISDLGFIPAGTKQFTIDIYGYGQSETFETLSELQAAINASTLLGFEAQVYDVNGELIGSPIQFSQSLVTLLTVAFKSQTMPSSDLGVNFQAVPGVTFTYPISLTLQNISGWTGNSVVHDMQNKPLTEIDIDIAGTGLAFVSSPAGAQFTLISDLGFITIGTDKFTITVQGYSGSTVYNTLSDLQAALKSNQLAVNFAAYVYDKNAKLIGNPIQIPSTVEASLRKAFISSETMPSSNLGVNSTPVPGVIFSYPISLTLENIANWANPVHDMQNLPVTEIDIDINGTGLAFVSSPPGNNFTLISDLGFIKPGTDKFTITVQGYSGSTIYNTLSDLQAALKSNQQAVNFAAYVYDNSGPIGNPIQIPSTVEASLRKAFISSETMPSSNLGVNLKPVPGVRFTYPISLTLENISGWTSTQQTPSSGASQATQSPSSSIKTLSQLMSTYSIPNAASNVMVTPVSWSGATTVPAWNMNINNNGGMPGEAGWPGGYAFVTVPAIWKPTPPSFAEVAADISTTINAKMVAAFNAGKVSIVLIATDSNYRYIPDLTQQTPVNFYLYVFDQTDNIIGQPIVFSANNAVGLPSTGLSFTSNQFKVGGLGLSGAETLNYPFVFTLTNNDVAGSTIPTVTKIDLTGSTPSSSVWSGLNNTKHSLVFTFTDNTKQTISFTPTQNYLIFSVLNNPKIGTNDAVVNITSVSQILRVESPGAQMSDYWSQQIIPALNKLISSLQPGQYIVASVDGSTNLNLYVLSSNT